MGESYLYPSVFVSHNLSSYVFLSYRHLMDLFILNPFHLFTNMHMTFW